MLKNNFLLNNNISKDLYFEVAKGLKIIDYHNHLNPEAMASERKFDNITQLWIHDDQYKHRLMRINGIKEVYITGAASDKEKFLAWMRTFPKTIGNPLFHWTQLEISEIFSNQIDLMKDDPEILWDNFSTKLGNHGLSVIDILNKWNVEILCPSDDILDNLDSHVKTTKRETNISVLPSLRSDSILALESSLFLEWLKKMRALTGSEIKSLSDYEEAISLRLDYFVKGGCKLSDHGLDSGFIFKPTTVEVAAIIFAKKLKGESLTSSELLAIKSYLLQFLGVQYGKRNITMQLHIGAQRTTSSRLKGIAGKFGGFAAIGNPCDIESLTQYLDSLEKTGYLPNTILYTLNPADNERFATLTGSFSEDGVSGKIQFGPAWWFNDHFEGIKKQLTDVASYGILNSFIGMTSDSRSFLSLSRHYYFRRILCHLLGEWVDKGILPNDFELLAGLVKNVCYQNAKNLITTGKI
jgi:glucuronate isomerase